MFKELSRRYGPGIVLALTITGSNDLVSNAASGAQYRYSLLWALALGLAVRWTLLSAAAKYCLVREETIMEGYRRVGKPVVWFIFVSAILRRHLSNLPHSLLIGGAAQFLFPLGESGAVVWSLLFIAAGFVMMFFGGYRAIEAFFKPLIAVMGGGLLLAALLVRPDPIELLRGAFSPVLPEAGPEYGRFLIVVAIIGGAAGTLSNLTYTYFIREKGWKDVSFLPAQRRDLLVSALLAFGMTAVVQVAAAGMGEPRPIESAADLINAFSVTLGDVGRVIFAFGLWAAVYSTYLGTNTGYALMATDIYRRYLAPEPSSEDRGVKDPVYRFLIVFFVVSPLYIFALDARPVWLVLIVTSLFVFILPILALVILRLTADRRLMGEHANGWAMNAALAAVSIVSLILTWQNAVELWVRL